MAVFLNVGNDEERAKITLFCSGKLSFDKNHLTKGSDLLDYLLNGQKVSIQKLNLAKEIVVHSVSDGLCPFGMVLEVTKLTMTEYSGRFSKQPSLSFKQEAY